jgi:uncharacterized protein (DUF305 family)
MKKINFLITTAILLAACNGPAQQKETHSPMHGNVMMQAMDKSMMAMHSVKQTGNADYDFASMMIPHHEGAIIMAQSVVEEGKDIALINFSNKVITAQKEEVGRLQTYLKTASQNPSANAEKFKSALDNSMGPMMAGMKVAKLTGEIDHDFVVLMIPHHQSAVDMAKAYLPYSNNNELRVMAQEIIKAQEEEIRWLRTQSR